MPIVARLTSIGDLQLAGELIEVVARTETTQSDFQQGTLSNIVVTTVGDLELTKTGHDISRTEDTQADFASGTLTDVTALASGDLTLAKGGTDYTKTETTQGDFQQGTLSNVVATAAGDLELAQQILLKDDFSDTNYTNNPSWTPISGTWSAVNGYLQRTSLTHYAKIATPSNQVYGVWEFDVWFTDSGGNSSEIAFISLSTDWLWNAGNGYGVIVSSSGVVALRKNVNGVFTSLIGGPTISQSTWYHIKVTRTLDNVFTLYVNGINYGSVTDSTFTSSGYFLFYINNYYQDTRLDNILCYQYASSGIRVSPVYNIGSVSVAMSSTISWTATMPAGTSVTVETNLSLDGGVTWQGWQVCTNGGAIPGIINGTNLSNARFQVRQTLRTNTTVTPQLYDLTMSVTVGYLSSGNRIAPALDLSSVGIVGDSTITWVATTPANTGVAVEVSLDGGATWAQATNGGSIPGITPGQSMAGKSLIWREVLTTSDQTITPQLHSLAVVVRTAYAAAGSRVALPLDLSPIGVVDTSSISWTATTPAGTSIAVETSLDDGATWQQAMNGGSIPGITTGMNLMGKSLLVRQTLTTTDITQTPRLHDLTVQVFTNPWPVALTKEGNIKAVEFVEGAAKVGLKSDGQFSVTGEFVEGVVF